MSITTPRGLVKFILPGAVLLVGLTACATRSDWAAVQGLRAKNITEVQLHKDAAPQGNRKIEGRLDSVTDDSITLRLKDGQKCTLRKQEVHQVRTRQPFSKWRLFLGALARTAGYIGGCYLWGDGPTGEMLAIALPAAFGSEIWSQLHMWKVYEDDPHQSSPPSRPSESVPTSGDSAGDFRQPNAAASRPIPASVGGEAKRVQVGVLEDEPEPERFACQ